MKFFNTNILFFILLLAGSSFVSAQDCTVNAGGNTTICGTSFTLQGSRNGSSAGNPTWTLVSKPAGAPDPVISNINALTPNVTGLTYPGNYVFQIAQACNSGNVSSQVTITAPGDASTFTAGPDITNVNAAVGTVNLNGVVPAGYTAQWSAYNIWTYERFGGEISNQNSQFGSPTSASTTFSLVKKADHDIDPAYVVTLRITSIYNANCWYEDTAVVRFIPNPQLIIPNTSVCVGSTENTYIDLSNTSPIFGTTTDGSAGNPTYGTNISMVVNSQPAGGNIAYWRVFDESFYFTGANVPGTYKFTVKITNSSGTYTTPEITYINQGVPPGDVSFLVASDPEQMMIYDTGGSGGEVQCGIAGSTAPIVFRFTLNAADPVTNTSNVVSSGITPPGGAPGNITTTGAGTATRTVTVTPPSGGWHIGTYKFYITTSNGACNSSTQNYYIHISDNGRLNVTVPNITVCYPGSGTVTATVPLPTVYKGIVNSSYLQDLDAQYDFTVISKPAGSGTPSFEQREQRLFTLNSTVIGNLTTPGEYQFKIKANPYNESVGAFLDNEYACSGTSLEGTFSIFVSPQINANAGSDQDVICNTVISLAGNDPGLGTGTWSVVSSPSGNSPVFSDASSPTTSVSAMSAAGTYTFRWTIVTGDCVSTDDVDVVIQACLTISGTVFNDANNNTVIESGEAGTSAGGSYIYLVDSSGIIANKTAVNSNGTYTINVGANKNYTLHLSQSVYAIGANTSTTPINHNIPGWVTTGENKNNNTGTGDGTPDGILSAAVVTSGFTNYNFGLKACAAGTDPPVFQERSN